MEDFEFLLDTGEGEITVRVEPTDNNGLMQYVIHFPETETGAKSWFVVFEREAGRWRQSPESLEQGPVLTDLLIRKISGQIDKATQ